MASETTTKKLMRCPHCGNENHHELVNDILLRYVDYSYITTEAVFISAHNSEIISSRLIEKYSIYQCGTCKKITVFHTCKDYIKEPEPYTDEFCKDKMIRQIYPITQNTAEEVPIAVSRTYNEAISIKNNSPNGFAGLIRKALESLLKDQNAEGKTLFSQIEDLSNRGILPPTIIEMGDLIRQIGNIGVHAGSEDVSQKQAEVINKFFNSIIEYVYIAPAKVKELQEELKKVKGKK